MAYIQRTTPPPNKVLSFSLRDFTGGLNNRSEQLKPNEASSVLNMMFADDTLMEKRYGQKYFNETEFDGNIVFIDEFKPYSDTDKLVVSTDTKIYLDGNLLATIQSKPSGVNHLGKYFFADGNKIYVYGKFPQATDTYTKVIGTAVNDYILLELKSPTDGHARLGTEHTKGVLNIDYTNKTIYYEPCENEFKDPFNGANKVPEKIKYLVSHKGRLFISGNEKDDDNIFISNIHNPYYFPVSLPIQIPPNSDKIVGLHVYDDSVVIGRYNDIHIIEGDTNNPDLGLPAFKLKKLNTHTGFANNQSVDISNNYLFFLGNDGNVYSLSSLKGEQRLLSTQILTQQIDLLKSPINVTQEDINNASSIFFKDEWYLSVGDKVLILSYRHRAWTMYNRINSKVFYILNNSLIWGSGNRIAEFDKENFLDFGEPYEAHWYSMQFDMENASSYKQFREFYLVAHTYNDYMSDVNVIFEVDYVDVKDRVTIGDQIAVWGRAKWGDRFITRNIVESLPFVIGRRGRNIRFKFFNGYFRHGDVDNYSDLEYYIGRIEGVLVYVKNESKFYLYTKGQWVEQTPTKLNQRMKIYQVNGDYELRGKR